MSGLRRGVPTEHVAQPVRPPCDSTGASCASAETTRWNCLTAGPERRPTSTADKHRSLVALVGGIMSACGEHKEEVSRAGNGGRAENTRRRPCGLGLGRAAREPRAQASDFLAAAPWRHSTLCPQFVRGQGHGESCVLASREPCCPSSHSGLRL